MKNIFVLFFPLFTSAQAWMQISNFPGDKRDDGVAVVIGNKAYFGTGAQALYGLGRDFYVLDLPTELWQKIADMPDQTQRQYACAFPGPGCFFVTCGDGVGGATTSTYKYTVASNSWTPAASKPGAGLIAASCFVFGDKVIVAGGKFQNNTPSNEVWEYTISSNSWIQKNNFPFTAIYRASSATVGGSGYLLFGITSTGSFRKELYKYDPVMDNWQFVSNFPAQYGRAYASMDAENGSLYVFGGFDSLTTYYGDSWFYKLSTNQWIKGPDIPGVARRGGMSCAANGNFYFSCGLSSAGRLNETWRTDVPVGVTENDLANILNVSPNPCKTILTIKIRGEKNHSDLHLMILNVYGQVILDITDFSNDQQLNLDLNGRADGIYFLKLLSQDRLIEARKIIKN